MKKLILGLLLISFQGLYAKTLVNTSPTKITHIFTYATAKAFALRVEQADGECFGYWVHTDSLGYETLLSVALSAKHTNSSVKIYADKDNIWTGSSHKYCHVHSLQLY